ncbi:MAG: tRNA lysidine(34) synthetase TilS [Melioribacteraceae bacterium]|nr:tRNA lysidine(34) synthetase TilS [Melioribacteraceae bacterium]
MSSLNINSKSKIEQKVIKFIADNCLINENDQILIALSGGADSVFAFLFFLKFAKKFKITISAIHINHKLRGNEAEEDQKFCEVLCHNHSIPFYKFRVNVGKIAAREKTSIEETGRNIRYKIFDDLIKSKGYDKIVTAHHSDDNIETILFNLFRGSGLKGLSGIPIVRGKIIRPLLSITKKEILEYLTLTEQTYREDASNNDEIYKRNFIRNNLIPSLKKNLNPNVSEVINNLSRTAIDLHQLQNQFVDYLIQDSVIIEKDHVEIKIDKLGNIGEDVISVLLIKIINENFSIEIESANISALLKLKMMQPGKTIELKKGLICLRERESFRLYLNQIEEPNEVVIKIGEKTKLFDKTIHIKEVKKIPKNFNSDGKTEYICGDNLDNCFILKVWKKGDKFIPLGMRGLKNVSDFLTDIKISGFEKKQQLVLQNRNKIVWVVGLRIDNRYKINDNCKKVLKICLS